MSLLGTTIGRIRLTDHLGKGGMGEVFVGYDQTLDRRVAVKCVRVGDRPKKIKGRFLQEARILSRLDHPNICQIYDFVESQDRDFLVMELVEGVGLKQAAADGLDDKTKLEVAQKVADVLVAAHAEGVVHRDLKPEHVMITAEGDIKVLDFGIAHSIGAEQDITQDIAQSIGVEEEATLHLASGSPPESGQRDEFSQTPQPPAYRSIAGSVVGTPSYMSPEQARGEPVTPASDMYTFGLLLQELFTGERPLPRQPMEVLLVEAAEGRSRPVVGLGHKLSELIEGLKDLKPGRRPTAREAADRIRFIREAPIRWLRRTVAALAILLIAAGVAKYTVDLEHERSAAIEARDQAEDLVAFMLEDLSGELRPVGRLEILEQVADKALEYYERAAPGTDAAAEFRRGDAFAIVADVLDNQGDRAAALEASSIAREIRQRLVEANPDRHDWRNQLALAHLQVGSILRLLGADQQPQAREALESAYAIASELVEIAPGHVEWRETLAEAHYSLGMYQLFSVDDPARARQAFEQAIAIYRQLAEEEPSRLHFRYRLAVLNGQGLGQTYSELGQEAESFAAIQRAHELYQELVSADPSNTRWQHGFAWENRRLGEHFELQGRTREALDSYVQALEISRRLLSLEPTNVDWQHGLAGDHAAIGKFHQRLGNPTLALASLKTSNEIAERLLEMTPTDELTRHELAINYVSAGSVLQRLGRQAEAGDAWQRAVELMALDAEHPDRIDSVDLENYAVALLSLGRPDDARPIVERLRARGWFEESAGQELIELCRTQGWPV